MRLEDFDYTLPPELIAQEPAPVRTGSRLMVLNRADHSITHRQFPAVVGYLKPGDLLVFNDTRVIPARLFGNKEGSGGCVEILLTCQQGPNRWEALVKPGKRIQVGHVLVFADGALKGRVVARTDRGSRIIEFFEGNFWELLRQVGEIPLPPYIKKPLTDRERYQTVFARHEGSSAAPTAALHFTETLLDEIRDKGVECAFVTLHIGPGTFLPVKTENIEEHVMHEEWYRVPPESVEILEAAKAAKRRIIPVGTTAVRTLESAFDENGKCVRPEGATKIFIYPGYTFKMVDALITNFHLPKSTLLMLVSALAGYEFTMQAYREAVKERYRFFSFGDSMIIL